MSKFYDWCRNKRMNFSTEQTYIAQRMLQEQGGWQPHLCNTKEFIIAAVKAKQPKSVRVLGSGWLLDVPIDLLVENCDRIVLSDIYHPKQIVNRYSKYNNITFETVDLTHGVVDAAYRIDRRKFIFDDFLYSIKSVHQEFYPEDLVISVNLLSQLSIFITDYVSKKVRISNDQLVEIAAAIQQNHLQNLPIGKSLLIADFEEEYHDEDDALIGTKPTVFVNIPLNMNVKEWDWCFDSQMTYREDCKTILKVIATEI